MNVVLIGFMGTGKSVVANALARKLCLKVLDIDSLIEKKEEKKISVIFIEKGEDYFRSIEKEVIEEISTLDGYVVSTGGGVFLDEENRNNLKQMGKVFTLTASVETILERVTRNNKRPLLNLVDDKRSEIEKLLSERKKYYDMADFTISTSGKEIDEVVYQIMADLYK